MVSTLDVFYIFPEIFETSLEKTPWLVILSGT